jgi:hypothetical protein
VREQMEQMAGALGIGELIVNTIVWDHAKRLRSYELLAAEVGLGDEAGWRMSRMQTRGGS